MNNMDWDYNVPGYIMMFVGFGVCVRWETPWASLERRNGRESGPFDDCDCKEKDNKLHVLGLVVHLKVLPLDKTFEQMAPNICYGSIIEQLVCNQQNNYSLSPDF